MTLYYTHTHLQRQSNYADCGVFAIANAMALCNGLYPEQLLYDVKMMRRHLDGCFCDRIFRHFPSQRRQVVRHTRRREVVSVYCSCRQLEAEEDKMIACDKCNEWYHSHCLNEEQVQPQAWSDSNFNWTCPACTF